MLRTCVLCCALAGVVGLVVGCNPSAENKPATAKKDEAIKAHKASLGDADKKIDDLKARAEKATGEEKTKLEAKWKDASAKRDAARKKLDELEKAAVEKWEAVNKEAEAALTELKKAVE
jgi:hypothetical protein